MEDVAWSRTPLTKSNVFEDVDRIGSFPKCVQPLHGIWKLSASIWHGRSDTTLLWDIWSWLFRLTVLLFAVFSMLPDTFRGINSLLAFVDKNTFASSAAVRFSIIGANILYAVSAIYSLVFAAYFVHNGYLQKLLQNLVSIKYIKEEYLENEIYQRIYRTAKKCRYFVIFIVIFQFGGWMTVNLVSYSKHKQLLHQPYDIVASMLWPFCWAFFKWFPFSAAFAILVLCLEILRIEKDVYMSTIAASHDVCQCKNKENKLYFAFSDIEFDGVVPIHDRYEIEKHLNDAYLNMIAMCNRYGAIWKWYMVILILCGGFSLLSAVALWYTATNNGLTPPMGHIIMTPTWYIFVVLFLLYELADLNDASENAKALLSATRFVRGPTHSNSINGDAHLNDTYVVDVNRLLRMMEFNPLEVKCAGVTATRSAVNGVVVCLATLTATSLFQYFFPTLST